MGYVQLQGWYWALRRALSLCWSASLASLLHAPWAPQRGAASASTEIEISSAVVVTNIDAWDYLGPFPIGKAELDGDPLAIHPGGIIALAKLRYNRTNADRLTSELLPNGGPLQWRRVTASSGGGGGDAKVSVGSAGVDWNRLVTSLSSIEITEFQGWKVGDFEVAVDGRYCVHCIGIHTVIVDEGIKLAADVYGRGEAIIPVDLTAGTTHTLFVRYRATPRSAGFSCKILNAPPADDPLLLFPPHFLPDLVDGHLLTGQFSVPAVNTGREWLAIRNAGGEIAARVAPGQLTAVPVEITHADVGGCNESDGTAPVDDVVLAAHVLHGRPLDDARGEKVVSVRLPCRGRSVSFQFTFVDHDGTVSHAAAIAPLHSHHGDSDCAISTPVVLSMHGTGVPPRNQADSYKHMKDGETDYTFGVRGYWTLAPTRHGAHNWEYTGHWTAQRSLFALAAAIERSPPSLRFPPVDTRRVLFAGHSMGGHGAWNAAVHDPDRAIGAAVVAGWLRKESYGDSNTFFKHDLATTHTDPFLRQILASSVVDHNADQLAKNVIGVPVFVRVGGEDMTVPPYHSRRMVRNLAELGHQDLTFEEVKGMGHWWWDTLSANDGGAVNDATMREFFERCRRGNATKKGENAAFSFVLFNPSTMPGRRGIRVLQQSIPFRRSVVSVEPLEDETAWRVTTANVDRMRLNDPSGVYRIPPSIRQLAVDGGDAIDVGSEGSPIDLCLLAAGDDGGTGGTEWRECDRNNNSSQWWTERWPETSGPARQVAARPFVIVVGSGAPTTIAQQRQRRRCSGDGAAPAATVQQATLSDEEREVLLQSALYIANQHYIAADTEVPILLDREVWENCGAVDMLEGRNVISVGGPRESLLFDSYSPVKEVAAGGFSLFDSNLTLGPCRYGGVPGVGAVFVSPLAGSSRLMLTVMGSDMDGLRDAIRLAEPTVPPMHRAPFANYQPDYVITSPEIALKGAGGFLAAGFFGRHWEWRSDSSHIQCVSSPVIHK